MDKCYPYGKTSSVAAGVYCAVLAVVGFSGNVLTLLAVPAARRKKK